MQNLVIPKGFGLLINAAMRYLVAEIRLGGLQETTTYHHNLDKPERVKAMESFPFLAAYAKELGKHEAEEREFSLWNSATHPEEFVSCVPERVCGYNETAHSTGNGLERTETFSGIVILRTPQGNCGSPTPPRRLRVKVTLDFASNDNLYKTNFQVSQVDRDEVLPEEAA